MSKSQAVIHVRANITSTEMVQIYEMPNYRLMREGKGSELLDYFEQHSPAEIIAARSEKSRSRSNS